jgi:precorrin-6B methylase 2
MSFETLIAASQRLNAAMEALAALGAELRLRREATDADPRVRRALQDIVRGIDPNLLDGVQPDQEAVVLGTIQAFFRQAFDLLNNPARAPGWTHDDPVVLQAQGQGSRMGVRCIEKLAALRHGLHETLRRPGAFLDVGTGVGWLAIEAARCWPALRVVGIDPSERVLALARENVAATNMASRIELRAQRVELLNEVETFTLAWLPGPFLSLEIVNPALDRTWRALQPGGWLVFALYAPPPDPLGEALTALRTVRGGGHPWVPGEIEDRLRAAGFAEVETFPTGFPILLVVGQRPAG